MRKIILRTSLASIVIASLCTIGFLTETYDHLWFPLGLPAILYFHLEALKKQDARRDFSLEISTDQLISRGRDYEFTTPVDRVKRVIIQRNWRRETKSVVLRSGLLNASKIEGLDDLDGFARSLASAIKQEKISVSRFIHL